MVLLLLFLFLCCQCLFVGDYLLEGLVVEFDSVGREEQLDVWVDGLAHGSLVKVQVTVALHERFEALAYHQLNVLQT